MDSEIIETIYIASSNLLETICIHEPMVTRLTGFPGLAPLRAFSRAMLATSPSIRSRSNVSPMRQRRGVYLRYLECERSWHRQGSFACRPHCAVGNCAGLRRFLPLRTEDAQRAWRYLDLFEPARYLSRALRKTVEQEMAQEALALRQYDEARVAIPTALPPPARVPPEW